MTGAPFHIQIVFANEMNRHGCGMTLANAAVTMCGTAFPLVYHPDPSHSHSEGKPQVFHRALCHRRLTMDWLRMGRVPLVPRGASRRTTGESEFPIFLLGFS